MAENGGRVTTREHYEAIIDLRDRMDENFERLENKMCERIDKQDERIDKIANWEKVIGAFGAGWLMITTWLGLRN